MFPSHFKLSFTSFFVSLSLIYFDLCFYSFISSPFLFLTFISLISSSLGLLIHFCLKNKLVFILSFSFSSFLGFLFGNFVFWCFCLLSSSLLQFFLLHCSWYCCFSICYVFRTKNDFFFQFSYEKSLFLMFLPILLVYFSFSLLQCSSYSWFFVCYVFRTIIFYFFS